MLKVLIHSIFPAPYRTGVFELLKKQFDVIVFFERISNENRNKDWFVRNDQYHLLTKKEDCALYKSEMKKLNEYDLVLAYDYSTFLAMKLMLKCIIEKIPYMINCDGAFINPHLVKDQIKRFFIKRAAGCLANGEHSKLYFKYYGATDDNIYMHNFSSLYEKDILKQNYNLEEKAAFKSDLGLENKPTAITVGQFIYRKGFDVLINSWANVRKEYNLLIIGGGDKKHEYQDQITSLGLKNVQLIDFMTPQQLKYYYRASDLFVLPTREDVWGLVINEAMASGLPVITTDKCIAGLELIKENQNGFIVPINDEKELAMKINTILSDYELSNNMAQYNLKKIKNYTIENIAKNHIEVFSKLLK